MFKTVIKEVGIVILILIAIILVFSVMLYDYMPGSKIVRANIEAYTVPEDVQEELQASVSEGQNIVKTLYIDSSDLIKYESSKD